jgi:SAM-dependent methyltransferase
MLSIYILILVTIFIVIFLFSSPQFSPIPYFPSQSVDLPKIIKALNLKNNQTIFDLGAGDGIVIFKAAKEAYKQGLNTQFVAVEINPVLILILHLRRLFHLNKKNIKIVYGDIFIINFNKFLTFNFSLLTFYLYISPWFTDKTIKNIKRQIPKFSIVSYMYPVKSLENKTPITKVTTVKGKNKIFIYQ